jgi:rubredoxin
MQKLVPLESYLCDVCQKYVYSEKRGEPALGIAAGTPFEQIAETFRCRDCGAPKTEFIPVHQIGWLDGPLSATLAPGTASSAE